jgi:hypothetical protein
VFRPSFLIAKFDVIDYRVATRVRKLQEDAAASMEIRSTGSIEHLSMRALPTARAIPAPRATGGAEQENGSRSEREWILIS